MKHIFFASYRLAPTLLFSVLLVVVVDSSCVKLPRRTSSLHERAAAQDLTKDSGVASRININTATLEELERLPGIGRGLAARIIAYRRQYGRFRRPEHLIMVRGISERRFLAMRSFITVG